MNRIGTVVKSSAALLALVLAAVGASSHAEGANRTRVGVNGKVVGHPTVFCNRDGIQFEMETNEPFVGQLYVRDQFRNERCRANFSNKAETANGGAFKLFFNQCGMRRQRIVSPETGMAYSMTMIVQFHPMFVTNDDKAYEVRCFYQERTVEFKANELSVSPITTQAMHLNHPMPKCTYSIRTSGLNGPRAKFVQVGEPVIHVFSCDNDSGTYRMLVKKCTIDDGKSNRQILIGDDGCSRDEGLFETPQYSGTKLVAFAEAKVFKWPDEVEVYFACQLTLCMREDHTCKLLTPPTCDGRRRRVTPDNSIAIEKLRLLRKKRNAESGSEGAETVDFDLSIQRLVVLDLDEPVERSETSAGSHLNTVTEASIAETETTSQNAYTTSQVSQEEEEQEEEEEEEEEEDEIEQETTKRKKGGGRGKAVAVVKKKVPASFLAQLASFEGRRRRDEATLGDRCPPSSPSSRVCYGPEYAIGFGLLLVILTGSLLAIAGRLCCWPLIKTLCDNWSSEDSPKVCSAMFAAESSRPLSSSEAMSIYCQPRMLTQAGQPPPPPPLYQFYN